MSATVRDARMIEQPGARNAACGRQRRIPQELCSPRPVRSSAACARSCHGRRVSAPTVRAVRPHQPRNPHRASVSSVQRREGKRVPCGHLGRRPKATRSAPKGSVSPVGCCAKRKATRRCEQIQGLCAAAHRTPIFAKGREARMIEQPGARNAASGKRRRIPPGHASAPRRKPRRARPLPSRKARPRAHRSRRAPAPAPQPAPRQRFERLHAQETRLAAPRGAYRRASRPHPPSEVWRAAALQNAFRIQRHARWIRQPCVSKATLRRFPPGSPPKEGEREAAQPPTEKIGASRAFPTRSTASLPAPR